MNQLIIDIITAESTLLFGEPATSLTAPGSHGMFQVLPEHTTFLSELEPGMLAVEQENTTLWYVISGGFAEVMQNHVRILADQAISIKNLDRSAIEAEKGELEAKINEADPYSPQADRLRKRLKFLRVQQDFLS